MKMPEPSFSDEERQVSRRIAPFTNDDADNETNTGEQTHVPLQNDVLFA